MPCIFSTVQAQVQKVEVTKQRKAARVEALTNQVQGLEERVHQLDSEKERAQAQVQQLQVCSAHSIQCRLSVYCYLGLSDKFYNYL